MSLFCYAVVCVLFSFAIILKRNLVALFLLSYGYLATVNVLLLFITVPWVVLQCTIVVFSDHTHFLYLYKYNYIVYSFHNKPSLTMLRSKNMS